MRGGEAGKGRGREEGEREAREEGGDECGVGRREEGE